MPKLSIIIPYKHGDQLRQEAIKQLISCIEVQTFKDFEVIIVEDTNGRGMASLDCKDKVNKVIAITDPENRPFNKSWCINVGIKQASSDNILMLDADVAFGKYYLDQVWKFKKLLWRKFFHGYNWIVLLPGRDNPTTRISKHISICSSGGSWFVDRKFFFETLGGMNENYFGYGREDSDLWQRANFILKGKIPELNYPIVHQYHNWEVVNQDNPIYQKNNSLWHYTKSHREEIIEKLKKVELGNAEKPTLI